MDPEPSAASGVLVLLRAATGEAHQRLEDEIGIERRVVDLAAYRRLLEVFLGFYRPLECQLSALDGWQEGLSLSGRWKVPWLEEDLLSLGMSWPEIVAQPNCNDLPPVTSLSHAFGCLYVLEGATLGGRHISAMMHNSPVPATARRFFASYGADTGTRWREFIAALENHAAAATDDGRAEIVRAARETFACLHRWFVRECLAHESSG